MSDTASSCGENVSVPASPRSSGVLPAMPKLPFHQCDLRGTDFREFQGSLVGVAFSGSILSDCNFTGLDLTDAKFDGADLRNASLRDANLTRADFSRALLDGSGVDDAHLAGANLTDAELGSAQERLENRLELAKSLADNLRSLFIAACGLFAYIGTTAMSANDALVLTNTTTLELPIVDAKVSVHAFFQLAGVLILALSTYILARVSHFARIVSKLPARLPQGLTLSEQVDPWVLSCVGILQRGVPANGDALTRVRPIFELFGARIPGVIVRWLGPVVLWALLLRFFSACQPQLAAWKANLGFALLVASFLGAFTVAYGLRTYSEFVDGVTPPTRASKYALAAGLAVVVVVGFRVATQLLGLSGAPGENLSSARLSGANLRGWNFATSILDDAILTSTNLVNTRFQEARLKNADLRRAELDGTTFVSAEMDGAKLAMSSGERTNFLGATLKGSDFRRARLPGVVLQAADLTGSQLAGLLAPQAIGADATFGDCIFDDANLSFAMLNGARFHAKDKKTTFFRARLVGADLSSTNLAHAQLHKADLTGANLTRADLEGAYFNEAILNRAYLEQTMFGAADGWRVQMNDATVIGPTFAAAPGRTQLNLAEGGFTGARLVGVTFGQTLLFASRFDNAVLENVDFGRANLTAATFSGARMKGVKIRDANLTGVFLSEAQRAGTDLPPRIGTER